MKYDSQVTELKNLLPAAKNIIIAVAAGSNIDKLAAGLALFLNLEAQGKQVSIISDDDTLVSQSHLFGIDHVQKNLPSTEGGNLTLTLEGVAASDGTVPSLEKLDWFAENGNLNLVFHVLSGQTFQPAKIVPHYQGAGFNLIFTIGAVNLNALGSIYSQNQSAFSGIHIVNIDNQVANSSFGQTNVIDANAAAVSEIMVNLLPDLGYNLDADSASNLLVGIFDSTNNLTDPKVTADTFMAVANCLRSGGKKPNLGSQIQNNPVQDLSSLIAKQPQVQVENSSIPDFMAPPVAGEPNKDNQPSPEEKPADEGVVSETVEPDWLTPKIFKGSSLG